MTDIITMPSNSICTVQKLMLKIYWEIENYIDGEKENLKELLEDYEEV